MLLLYNIILIILFTASIPTCLVIRVPFFSFLFQRGVYIKFFLILSILAFSWATKFYQVLFESLQSIRNRKFCAWKTWFLLIIGKRNEWHSIVSLLYNLNAPIYFPWSEDSHQIPIYKFLWVTASSEYWLTPLHFNLTNLSVLCCV